MLFLYINNSINEKIIETHRVDRQKKIYKVAFWTLISVLRYREF